MTVQKCGGNGRALGIMKLL